MAKNIKYMGNIIVKDYLFVMKVTFMAILIVKARR